ncbi:MAG TPA: FMN-binding negative transcriptional regulator [Steroidobacteraceae bacterium]
MYIPTHFRETRPDVLHGFVTRFPLATLITVSPDGISANHVPMLWIAAVDGLGRLHGHVARANSLWREAAADSDVLAVFTGPQHYVSPSWYPSKREHGKVVPTWNYSSVQIRGRIRFIHDEGWLRTMVASLTERHEQQREQPWRIEDAPAGYLDDMLRAIVGLEITVSAVEGKFKGSQNRDAADRIGVANALRAEGLSVEEVAQLAPPPDLPQAR